MLKPTHLVQLWCLPWSGRMLSRFCTNLLVQMTLFFLDITGSSPGEQSLALTSSTMHSTVSVLMHDHLLHNNFCVVYSCHSSCLSYQASCPTCQASCPTCHASCPTYQASCPTCHTSCPQASSPSLPSFLSFPTMLSVLHYHVSCPTYHSFLSCLHLNWTCNL